MHVHKCKCLWCFHTEVHRCKFIFEMAEGYCCKCGSELRHWQNEPSGVMCWACNSWCMHVYHLIEHTLILTVVGLVKSFIVLLCDKYFCLFCVYKCCSLPLFKTLQCLKLFSNPYNFSTTWNFKYRKVFIEVSISESIFF